MENYNLIKFYKKFLIAETEMQNDEKVPIGIIKFKKRNGRYPVAEFKSSEIPEQLIGESRKLSIQYIEDTIRKEFKYMTFFEETDKNIIEYLNMKGLVENGNIKIDSDTVEKLIKDKHVVFSDFFEIEYKLFMTGIYVQMVINEKFWKEFTINNVTVDPRVFYYATFNESKNKFDLCVKVGVIREKEDNVCQSVLPKRYSTELLVEQLKLCSIEHTVTETEKPLTKEQIKNREIPEKFTVVTFKLTPSDKYNVEKYLQFIKDANNNIIKKFNCVRLHYEF